MLSWIVIAAAIAVVAASTANVFVAVNGSDANAGTDASAPLKSLERAQAVARALSANSTVAVNVHLSAGDFYLDSGGKPLVLNAADSGVSWVGSGATSTAIRGGMRVTGWSPVPEMPGVFKAPSPYRNTSAFFQLMVGDRPATTARFPNRGGGWLFNWTAGRDEASFRWSAETGLPAKFETAFAKVWVWHPYGYVLLLEG
jgi:hypothetical protein